MKNAFYFIWKALLILKIVNFCVDFLFMFDQKYNVDFKNYDITT